MDRSDINLDDLLSRVRTQEAELQALRTELALVKGVNTFEPVTNARLNGGPSYQTTKLQGEEYKRYGRQMILPEIGMPNQLKLHDTSVLIVGLGGLGCPAAAYLAGAGIGTLGLVDGDVVEVSNLHRQIIHTTQKVGKFKVESAADYIRGLNPHVRCKLHNRHLEPSSALEIFGQYDLVLDCTDHPSARYLISDASVCSGVPLVSAAALRTDGQLVVLNFPPFSPVPGTDSGPCYRCLNPKPPPAETVLSCGEGGILGPVVGTMGVLMATEAIKIITSPGFPFTGRSQINSSTRNASLKAPQANMLIYSAFSNPPFRTIKLKGKRVDCPACSSAAERRTITSDTLRNDPLDYAALCGTTQPITQLEPSLRIEPKMLHSQLVETSADTTKARTPVLIDVRDATQFGICKIANSVNVPVATLEAGDFSLDNVDIGETDQPLVVVCRYGNDSQGAVQGIRANRSVPPERLVFDLKGGLMAWREQVDPAFPEY